MTATELYDFLCSVPSLFAEDTAPEADPAPDLPAAWGDLDADVVDEREDHLETVRRRFLATLGYEPGDVSVVGEDDVDDRGRIAVGLPIVDHDLPMARRFVLRVGEDPAPDPPVPDHPEALIYPTLAIVRESVGDVDYAVQLTEARLVVDAPDGSRTYMLTDPGDADPLPSYEPLTPAGAEDLYARLAVDAGPEDQTSIAEY